MKFTAFIFLSLMTFSAFGSATGLLSGVLSRRPEFLVLEKHKLPSGKEILRHFDDDNNASVPVEIEGEQGEKLTKHFFKSSTSRLFCDGDFTLTQGYIGGQFVHASKINVCLDEEGGVVAKKDGLFTFEIEMAVEKITPKIRKRHSDGSVSESQEMKDAKTLEDSAPDKDLTVILK